MVCRQVCFIKILPVIQLLMQFHDTLVYLRQRADAQVFHILAQAFQSL